jgi:transposase-like protein
MKNSNQKSISETVCGIDNPEVASENSSTCEVRDVLSQILREGAQKMLQSAIQKEVDEYLQNRSGIVGEDGRRLVVRNGSLPERELVTGVGAIQLRQPRVRDKRSPEEREVFSSSILPKYLRKTKSIEELVPWLYLKGISTNDFPEALQSLLGKDAKGFSPTTITRLKSVWEEE